MDLEECLNRINEKVKKLEEQVKNYKGPPIPKDFFKQPPFFESEIEDQDEESPEVKPKEQKKEELLAIAPPEQNNQEDNLEFVFETPEENDEFSNPILYYSPPRFRPMREFGSDF